MSNIAPEQASALIQHFAEATSSVLSQISGTALEAQCASLEDATKAATLIRIDIAGALEGLCEIAISAPMSAHLAALLTGETPETASEISSDTREAAAELMQQICGNAADRLRNAFGPLELKPHIVVEREPLTGARQLILVSRQNNALEFELHIVRLTAEQPAEAFGVAEAQKTSVPAFASPASGNLDLLLDIELNASLRFGSRQMLLKDIIELCSGSVVELDRRVQDPVDLLIDGRVVAQGEVVIVEGNYGLRILQVAAPGEKIACLP